MFLPLLQFAWSCPEASQINWVSTIPTEPSNPFVSIYSWTRYFELGYLELPAISNRLGFPLDLPLFIQSFTMGYLELGYLEHPAISNCFSLPLAQINPGNLEL